MNRIIPILLLAASAWIFVGVIRPQFEKVGETNQLITERQQTLDDAERVIERRDAIMEEYASISNEEVDRLKVLIPDRIDVVRLILDVSRLAEGYNLRVKNVSAGDVTNQGSTPRRTGGTVSVDAASTMVGDSERELLYETATVGFQMSGTYDAFVAFITDLEQSLKLVDLDMLSVNARNTNEDDVSVYSYDVTMRVYRFIP